MNFLAHSFHSPKNESIVRLSCMTADAFKGKKWLMFHPKIANGIVLHRKMDEWFDNHRIIKSIQKLLPDSLGRYRNVAIDMLYDHYIATNQFSEATLQFYNEKLKEDWEHLKKEFPEGQKTLGDYIFRFNWLTMYRSKDGLERILEQMNTRIKYRVNLKQILPFYIENQDKIDNHFNKVIEEARNEFKN